MVDKDQRYRAAEPFFKHIDDAAARFLRSIFLFGAGLIGVSFVLIVAARMQHLWTAEISLLFYLRLAVLAMTMAILAVGALFCFLWGWAVLRGAINAILLARSHPPPDQVRGLRGRALWLFSGKAPVFALALPALALAVAMASSLVLGMNSAHDWIATVTDFVFGATR